MDIVKQNMLMTSELIKVIKILEENNMEAISFKGPVLSQLAYGDVVSRQYCDLDILVKKEKVNILKDLMKTINFKRNLELTSEQEQIWIKNAHDISFSSINNINFEFHWSMLDLDHPINLENINFFENIKKTKINDFEINNISNEEFLIYLCIHGSKHLYERIEWVVDIDKFIRNQEIDWYKINSLIKNDNSRSFFYLGLYLANLLYETPLNDNLEKYFSKEIIFVSKHILEVWNKKEVQKEDGRKLKYMLKLFISKKDKLKYINKVYFKPTFNEYWYISLPKYLYFLYYPLRQYLLIKKYFFDK